MVIAQNGMGRPCSRLIPSAINAASAVLTEKASACTRAGSRRGRQRGRTREAENVIAVPNGSLVDMTMFTKEAITKTAVNEVVRTGIAAKFAKYVEYAQDPIVSSDVKMSPYSSTYDSLATTMLGEYMVKTIAWYDNGWGYAHRVGIVNECIPCDRFVEMPDKAASEPRPDLSQNLPRDVLDIFATIARCRKPYER